ncbi:MAG: carbon-nitrogen hydrolase family protein [Propionibacteriaceae bacterium]
MSDTHGASPAVRVAAGQFASTRDVRANLAQIAQSAQEARRAGCELVAFPEASSYDWKATAEEISEHVDSDADRIREELAQIAERERIAVVAGVFTPSEGDRPRNTMVAFGADGESLARYDKVHLYDSFGYRESDKFTAAAPEPSGAELAVFEFGPFTVGLLNCYDLRFPEFTRALVDAGADTLLISSAWVAGEYKSDHWQTLLRARAIENTTYVIASSQPGPHSVGLSMIIDPLGRTLAGAGTEPDLIHADLSSAHLRDVRELVPSLQHRKYTITPAPPASTSAPRPTGAGGEF